MRLSQFIKTASGWVIGIIGYEFIKSSWLSKQMDWQFIINFSVAGSVEIFIGLGLRSFLKKESKN